VTLVALNCGSSSVKAAAFDVPSLQRTFDEQVDLHAARAKSPDEVVQEILQRIAARSSAPIVACVHRVVHGGERFTQPTLIDTAVLAEVQALSALAPLHNPPAIEAIVAARKLFTSIRQFAVFDTAFHATLPPRTREYALSPAVREAHGIRRFGFHGISHEHLMRRVATAMARDPARLRIVSCHLGSGASVAAIECGRSIDTSMGMTPLEGLVMATRAGDLDPGVVLALARARGLDAIDTLLARQSGLLGLTGVKDMRAIEQRARQGDADCELALEMFAYRVRKYIGAYTAAMGGIDAVGFTGGIGENSALVRERCVEGLGVLGVTLDPECNRSGLAQDDDCAEISSDKARVRTFVLRADEESAMARSVLPLLAERQLRK
jgi:acetate kinase